MRPGRSSRACRSATCWLLALSALAAADQARVVRGPWWWHSASGEPQIAVAVAGPAGKTTASTLDGVAVTATDRQLPLTGDADGATAVLILGLPNGSAGELRVTYGVSVFSARVRAPPAGDAAVRLALAGGHSWPDRAGLERLSPALGGPAQLVLALGSGVPARLGTGGWEADIPLAVVAAEEPGLAACSGGEDARWRHGLRFGVLGLPASPDRGRADLALARDLSPWLVYLDVPAGWDPAIGQSRQGDTRDLGVLLAACQRLQVPLALGAGTAGLVSEPLSMEAGGAVRITPGGVRYVLPIPAADDGLTGIRPSMAVPLEGPSVGGLHADLASLSLVFAQGGEAVRLTWTRGDDAAPALGNGEAGPLLKQLLAAESLNTLVMRNLIARLSWMPRSALAAELPGSELLNRLREEGGAQGRMLVRRLALIASDRPDVAPIEPGTIPLAERDRLLWRIATIRDGDAAGWRGEAAATTDPIVLRALFADVTRDPGRSLLPVLVDRVGLQAAGTLPLDADPFDQHRLFAMVFDDIRLSPTPLRPWAIALREKADPLARGPIDRFLARHGELRPVP